MKRALPYLRKLGLLMLICVSIIGVGRAYVWVTARDTQSGLSGAPQVFVWHSVLEKFGGYSALIIDPTGTDLITGSDRQHFVTGTLTRAASGQITAITDQTLLPILIAENRQATPFQGDLEGLTRMADGRIGLAFESLARVRLADSLVSPLQSIHPWDTFKGQFNNEMFEAIATLPDGTLLAIFQRGDTPEQTPAYRYDGTAFTGPTLFPVTHGFDVSGADVGPDNCLYILERHYGVFTGFQFQVIRMDPYNWDAPRTLIYRAKPMSLGNAEGISIWQNGSGLMATLITDDGFPPLQPTRIIELPLSPARGCADQ